MFRQQRPLFDLPESRRRSQCTMRKGWGAGTSGRFKSPEAVRDPTDERDDPAFEPRIERKGQQFGGRVGWDDGAAPHRQKPERPCARTSLRTRSPKCPGSGVAPYAKPSTRDRSVVLRRRGLNSHVVQGGAQIG